MSCGSCYNGTGNLSGWYDFFDTGAYAKSAAERAKATIEAAKKAPGTVTTYAEKVAADVKKAAAAKAGEEARKAAAKETKTFWAAAAPLLLVGGGIALYLLWKRR